MASKRSMTQLQTQEHVHETPNNALKIKRSHLTEIAALTQNQREFFNAYDIESYFIVLLGSAGTGKTFISLYKALCQVLESGNPFDQVVIVRSSVQSREMGHMPGDIESKMALFEQPYMQICSALFNRSDAYQRLKEQGKIDFVSTSFIRGMTFDNSIILVDECQNLNWSELSTIMTRVGNNSKIIFSGDYSQNDLNKKANDMSGLQKFHNIAKLMPSCVEIEFTINDIVRSSLVRDFIIATEKWEMDNG